MVHRFVESVQLVIIMNAVKALMKNECSWNHWNMTSLWMCVLKRCLVAQLYKPVHLDIQPKLKLNKYSFATEAGHWNYWLIIMIIFVGAALPSSGCSSYYFMCNFAVRSLGHERHWCPRCSKCLWGHLAGESQNASLLHDAFKGGYSIFDYLTQHSKSHIL